MPTDRRLPGGAFFARFLSDRRGTTAIEYGLIAAFVCLAIIGSVAATGSNVSSGWAAIGTKISDAFGL
jgi:pilus assembly protein Flp/PilA